MATIRQGEWVHRKGRPGRLGFVVRAKQGYWASVRWLGKAQAVEVAKKSLKATTTPSVLYLEGNLDQSLDSRRTQVAALQGWCESFGVKFASKSIHQLSDIPVILRQVGARAPAFLHLACHGNQDDDGRTYLSLWEKDLLKHRIYLDDRATWEAFRAVTNAGIKYLFIDACAVGKFGSQLSAFRKGAHFKAVAAVSRDILDYESLLVAPALYFSILAGQHFPKAVSAARDSLARLGIKGGQGHGQSLLRVVHS